MDKTHQMGQGGDSMGVPGGKAGICPGGGGGQARLRANL